MMSDAAVDAIRDEALAFMGTIIAGQSHEVTNVLNIINELAGLEQDVLSSVDPGEGVPLAKLKEIGRKIQFQVARGETIIRHMNLFAHSVDTPRAVFDVRDAVNRIVFLAERWTRLRRVELRAELPDDTTALENHPFFFQCAVFVCIDAASLTTSSQRQVTVSYSVSESGTEVIVNSADPIPRTPEITARTSALRRLVDELGGELRAMPNSRGDSRFVFFVPSWAKPGSSTHAAQKED